MSRIQGQQKQDAASPSGLRGRPGAAHGRWSRGAAGALALPLAAVAVLALAVSGQMAPSGDAQAAAAREALHAGQHRTFLADLAAHRPRNEQVLATGRSTPGVPVALDTTPYAVGGPYRIAYRCHGAQQAAAAAITSDGRTRRFPRSDCGRPLTSIAVEGYRSVTLGGDGRDTLILWAVTATRAGRP
jgi:hypothetical protein